MHSLTPQIYHVKSFTQDKTQGNPAGVFFPSDSLSELEMIQMAKMMGYSESAFLQTSLRADVKVVFASPHQIVNLCGHGTIAAFHIWLANQSNPFGSGHNILKMMETAQGDLIQVICHQDGLMEMVQKQPNFGSKIFLPSDIAPLLGMEANVFLFDFPIQIVSVGTPKLLVPLCSQKALFSLQPDFEKIKQFGKDYSCFGIYPFYRQSRHDNILNSFDFEARQFNPLMGIDEDPITGIAAGALGAYNQKYTLIPKEKFIVRQGYQMNQGGEIYVQTGADIKIGGYAVS